MNACRTTLAALLFVLGADPLAHAQTPDLEPGVQTSPSSPPASPPPQRQSAPSAVAAPQPASKPAPGPAAQPAAKPGLKAQDRIELDTTQISGNRELPKVMYVVPWKRSDIGDLSGKPMNSLVDEILAPVDRDVFKREVVYYNAVQADTSQNGAPPKPAQQGEK